MTHDFKAALDAFNKIPVEKSERLNGYVLADRNENYAVAFFENFYDEIKAALTAQLTEKQAPAEDVREAVSTCRNWQQRDRVVDSVELSGAIETLIRAATSKPCGCEGLVEVLENFPDMQDGRSSPEELREAASKWFWDELTPALAAYRKGGE